jgi:peptide/nickel transport system permease protein
MAALAEPTPVVTGAESRRTWVEGLLRPGAVVGIAMLAIFVLLALLAPLLAPYDKRQRVGEPFEEPSSAHWLGLDDGGIDMLTLMLWGARVSLLVGFGAALIALCIGGTIGIIAGYFGGRTDTVLAMIISYVMVIPDVPLIIVVAAIWGSTLTGIILIIGVLYWTFTARVIRAQVKGIRARAYVERAQAVGVSAPRIILTHVLPQVAPLSNAFRASAVTVGAWWAIVPPGVAVALVILACTMIGRSLEDALNPRLRASHLSVRRFRVRDVPARSR